MSDLIEEEKLESRFLGIQDREQVLLLSGQVGKIWRLKAPAEHSFSVQELLEDYFGRNPHKILIGCFRGSRLVSTLGMRLWRKCPFWTVTHLRSFDTEKRLNFKATGIPVCFRLALAHAESLRRFKFYFLWQMRASTLYPLRKSIVQRHLDDLDRYYQLVEEIVPADTLPEFEWQRSMLGGRSYSVPTVISSGNLRPEFRGRLVMGERYSQYRPVSCFSSSESPIKAF